MNNRNCGNFNSRAFSPQRMNHPQIPNNNSSSSSNNFNQFYGDHASVPYFQYAQNTEQRNRSQMNARFENYEQRDRRPPPLGNEFVRFTDWQAQSFGNHRPMERRTNSFSENRQFFGANNRQMGDSGGGGSRTFTRFDRGPPPQQQRSQPFQAPPPQNRPRPSATSTSSRPMKKLSFSDIFSVSRQNEDGMMTYNCNLCKLSNLPEKNLDTHSTGKRHRHHVKMIEEGTYSNASMEKMTRFKSSAGQLYSHRPMFDMIVKDVKQPLIALTYTVEILDSTLKEPSYVCVLCSKRCDPRTVVNHLISQTHRMNYLERHFPRLVTILHNNRRFNEDMDFRQQSLINIAKALEELFGRATAFVYDGSDYEATKDVIFENITKKKHGTQEDVANVESILLKGVSLENSSWEASHPPELPPPSTKPTRKRKVDAKVLDEYNGEVLYAQRDLEAKLENYERDPESHPFYKKEWELFWNRKVDEMTARGGDPKNCNFHDEWCDFFLERIKDLHREEVKWKTEQIRRKFGFTPEDVRDFDLSPKRAKNDGDGSSFFSGRKGRFHNDHSDDEDDDFRPEAPRVPKDVLYVKEKAIFDDFLQKLGTGREPPKQLLIESTTLIKTLRLLTSLEIELGLLAPKILELLSKSLAFERESANSADDLLYDSENLNLIETAKEKILGLQTVNLIPTKMQVVAQRALVEIDRLIEKHEAMVKVKASLREMGKEDASAEEIEMLMEMIKKGRNGGSGSTGEPSSLERMQGTNRKIRTAIEKLQRQDMSGM